MNDRRRQKLFSILLVVAFLLQGLGIFIAWLAHSNLQIFLGGVGSSCTLYLFLTNQKQVISTTSAYLIGLIFVSLRLGAELVDTFIRYSNVTSMMYMEAILIGSFSIALFKKKEAARIYLSALALFAAGSTRSPVPQVIEIFMLGMVYGVLYFTSEHGRQMTEARLKQEALERQLVWDATTGTTNRRLLEEQIRTLSNTPHADEYTVFSIRLTAPDGTDLQISSFLQRKILQATAKSLRNTVSDTDTLGRWDENTFLLISHSEDQSHQQVLMQKLRDSLNTLANSEHLPFSYTITISPLSQNKTLHEAIDIQPELLT